MTENPQTSPENEPSKLRQRLIGGASIKRFAASFAFIYGALLLFGIFGSEALIFLPHAPGYADSDALIKLRTKDGPTIAALHYKAPGARYTILYSHGNAEDLRDIDSTLRSLRRLGFSVFAYDYQGYGQSQGKPSENGCYRDIEAAYNYLTNDLKVPPSQIILYGRSVGGGPTCYLASQKEHAGLILESCFTSAFRVAIPIPLLPFDRFNNAARLANYQGPVLVMHGRLDRVVPFSHGEKLFGLIPSTQKTSLFVDKAGHNNFKSRAGQAYREALTNFAKSLAEK